MPSITLNSRLLVPNNATQTTNDTSGSGGGANDGLPPQYISVFTLFTGFLLVAVLVIIVSTRRASRASNVESNTGPDRHRQHENPNLFQFREFRSQNSSSRTGDARASLDAVSPTIPFRKLQSQGDDHKDKDVEADTDSKNRNKTQKPTPPDQTGTAVVCIICLDDFQPQSSVRVLLCGHIFHAICIDEWLLVKHHCGCPLCGQSYLADTIPLPAKPGPSHTAGSTSAGNQWGLESPQFVNVSLR